MVMKHNILKELCQTLGSIQLKIRIHHLVLISSWFFCFIHFLGYIVLLLLDQNCPLEADVYGRTCFTFFADSRLTSALFRFFSISHSISILFAEYSIHFSYFLFDSNCFLKCTMFSENSSQLYNSRLPASFEKSEVVGFLDVKVWELGTAIWVLPFSLVSGPFSHSIPDWIWLFPGPFWYSATASLLDCWNFRD